MDKVTQINVEGHNYGFVAGNAIKAVCGAASADYIKTVLMPEGANVEEGMLIAVTFSNGNSAGYAEAQDAYSSDGETFYWDELLTDPITLPPQGCYEMTLDTGEHYFYTAYPCLSFGGNSYPVCMSNGKPFGGEIWDSGDIVIFLFLDNKMLSLISKGGSGGGSSDFSRQGAYCNTAGATDAKVAEMKDYVANAGMTFAITFAEDNSYQGALTLDVNGTGACPLYINGVVSSSTNYTISAGTYMCRYDGTNYYVDTGYFVSTSRFAAHIPTSQPDSIDGAIWIG